MRVRGSKHKNQPRKHKEQRAKIKALPGLLICLLLGCSATPEPKPTPSEGAGPFPTQKRRDYFTFYKVVISKSVLAAEYQYQLREFSSQHKGPLEPDDEIRLQLWAKESVLSRVTLYFEDLNAQIVSSTLEDESKSLPWFIVSGLPVNFEPSKNLLKLCTIEPMD